MLFAKVVSVYAMSFCYWAEVRINIIFNIYFLVEFLEFLSFEL